MTKADQNNKKELVIIRIFAAPRELVFKAWTDPDLFNNGGARKALLALWLRWTCGWVASISTACARPTAKTFGAKASSGKS